MTNAVIDLMWDTDESTTSSSHHTVTGFREGADGIIELLSDSDEDCDDHDFSAQHEHPFEKKENKRTKPDKPLSTMEMSDELCNVEVIPSMAPPSDTNDCHDKECWIVGHSGHNALSDYPH